MSVIRLRTFGGLELRGPDGVELSTVLAQPKRLGLLVYLAAARPGGVLTRDHLLATFWPELDEARARDALNQALRFLRQALGPGVLARRSAEEVGVDPSRLWCDVRAFRSSISEERWDDAMGLYQGDFLPGVFLQGADGFERWLEDERAQLREQAAGGARELARRHEEGGALTLAISWGRRALDLAPDDERALRRLLGLHVRAGDHAGALHLYDDFARRLETEWGSAPALETRRLVEALRVAPIHQAVGSSDPAAGLLAGRYRVERALGAGGTATVFQARDLKHDRDVAVKVLHPEITEGLSRDRFVREIHIAGQLQHPGIVPLFDSGEAEGRLFYVMPFVPGESLRRRLRRGPMDPSEVVTILREVADGLGHAHEHGVVHRDIKPENVVLIGQRALVTDFGIARAAEAARTPGGPVHLRVTQPGTSLGTPAYMAPEQAAGDPEVSHLADLYSLGVLGYEMLAGRPPFTGASPQQILAAKLTRPAPDLLEARPDTPRWLAGLLMECLQRDPARRPQSARDVSAALAAERPSQGTGLPPAGKLAGIRRLIGTRTSMARARGWAMATLVATVVVAGAAWLVTRSGRGGADPNLVAVLPFRVAGSTPVLAELREGVLDLVSIYLTGDQGGLRAVEPATVLRAWRARAGDRPGVDLADREAMALGRSLGAGWVLQGSLVGTGGDVLLRASLTPVSGGGRPIHASVTGAADSILSHVPRLLGRVVAQLEGISADQSFSLTTSSLNAVRAYLAGQRHYRRGEYDLAAVRFTEAIGVDSSFSLAGLGFLLAHEWAGNTNYAASQAITAVTWRHRGRLRAKDRALVEAVVGPLGPELSPLADVQRARERATRVAPERFESWYLLGDHLFHVGALLGIDQPLARAEDAFRQARSLDSGQAGILQHLLLLAAHRGDTAQVRTWWAEYQRATPAPAVRFKDAWLVGQVLGDSAMVREALTWFDGSAAAQAGLASLTFSIALFPAIITPLRALLEQSGSAASRSEQRSTLASLRWYLAMDAGRPSEAARHFPEARPVLGPEGAILAEVFWGGMSGHETGGTNQASGPGLLCARGLADAIAGRWNAVGEAVARLGRLPRPPGDPLPGDRAAVCARILVAAHAQGTRHPEAGRLIRSVDSLLLTVPYLQITWENLMVARLLETEGDHVRALAAASRYRYGLGYPSFLSAYLREEARLAAMVGDRDRAVRQWNRYLAMRGDPEPSEAGEVADALGALGALAP